MLDPAGSVDLSEAKQRLLASLRHEVRDERVVRAMERVPREAFVPPAIRHQAYEDIPLPLGQGQTISQPFIVAVMTAALELKERDRVLEVGTGSGYQAAVIAELVPSGKVISTERLPELAEAARGVLASLGYGGRIEVRPAGETLGCPEEAPFDAIIVTAGSPKLPHELLDQLAAGGRMVVPVGSMWEQDLLKVVKTSEGYSLTSLGPCRFVPLIGKGGWESAPTPPLN